MAWSENSPTAVSLPAGTVPMTVMETGVSAARVFPEVVRTGSASLAETVWPFLRLPESIALFSVTWMAVPGSEGKTGVCRGADFGAGFKGRIDRLGGWGVPGGTGEGGGVNGRSGLELLRGKGKGKQGKGKSGRGGEREAAAEADVGERWHVRWSSFALSYCETLALARETQCIRCRVRGRQPSPGSKIRGGSGNRWLDELAMGFVAQRREGAGRMMWGRRWR